MQLPVPLVCPRTLQAWQQLWTAPSLVPIQFINTKASALTCAPTPRRHHRRESTPRRASTPRCQHRGMHQHQGINTGACINTKASTQGRASTPRRHHRHALGRTTITCIITGLWIYK
eukprot:166214-Pelagomonas_calceolata.AAC.4